MGARDVMKSQLNLVANKTCNSIILENFFKDKVIKGGVSEMYIINTSSTQEIIGYNKCQMRFLNKLVFEQEFDKKLMINVIIC